MSKKVIKKDGRVQPFIKEKIVISAVKTGAPVEVARKIADNIEKHTNEDIKTDWIRKKVLDELHIQNPDWPKRWYSYDKNIKRLHKYGLK